MNSIPRVYVNQRGYLTDSTKYAVIPYKAERFEVIDAENKSVFSGVPVYFGYDEASGDEIYRADFSKLNVVGKYKIRVNDNASAGFEIGKDIYSSVCRDTLHAFYYLRCGCELEEKWAGKYVHGKCHSENAVLWENPEISADVSGGWHDAGDYGRYVTAAAAAAAHMLLGYKMFPERFCRIFSDIPNDGNMPDILAECRVELEWLMKMQRADGGVYHKVTTKGHAPFIMPEEDKQQLYLLPVSSSATADTAAVCAMAAEIYGDYDKDLAYKLTITAEKAYGWLEKNPDFLFDNPDECTTGVYGERSDRDNRFWAAAQMYSLTGEYKYHKALQDLYAEEFPKTALGYSEVGGLGCLAYILAERADKQTELADEMKKHFVCAAEKFKAFSDSCGYKTALMPKEYGWGSNMGVLVRAMIFIIADTVCGCTGYSEYALAQMNYILGLNAVGMSYISGIGEKSINAPHFRPSSADGIEKCHEGFVSGGANCYLNDEFAKKLIPQGTPPMKCFADDERCYSLNEITIYWNSPAVFVSGYFSE